ncbi:MAG TPA: class I SAM-dependent methyltransferase [Ktedonobacterales bacterium]
MGVSTSEMLEKIYSARFGPDVLFRQRMWRILCDSFFRRFVPPDSTVMEVGAGYCEFINAIPAQRKIAVDMNPRTAEYAAPGVEVALTSSTDLSAIESGTVDVAFASNFFEHLTRDDILATMREVARTLKPGGRFLILQPNIRYCARDFWMFFDHITPLDQYSLVEALEMSGFRAVKTIVRFLPFTTKSKLPKSLLMVRAYLAFPLIWRVLGQQTFVVAELDTEGRPR